MEGQALSAGAVLRPPVEVLFGRAPDAERGIEEDFAMLDGACAQARVWVSSQAAVVLGASRDLRAEVREQECRRRDVAVLRRASGGGTVVVGPGTVQYAFVIAHASAPAPSLDAIKRESNRIVCEALGAGGATAGSVRLESDASGDLRIGDRKVGGVALRRRRHATLLHGTLLTHLADLEMIAAVLEHPVREPDWRRRRPHHAFLTTLPPFDLAAFTASIRNWGQAPNAEFGNRH